MTETAYTAATVIFAYLFGMGVMLYISRRRKWRDEIEVVACGFWPIVMVVLLGSLVADWVDGWW